MEWMVGCSFSFGGMGSPAGLALSYEMIGIFDTKHRSISCPSGFERREQRFWGETPRERALKKKNGTTLSPFFIGPIAQVVRAYA